LVEIKRVNASLSERHLKQVSRYAIDKGCEWTLLTNGKQWQLYHISFEQPPQYTLVDNWDIIENDLNTLAEKFSLLCYTNLKKGSLEKAWRTKNALTTHNLLKTILSESSIASIRRSLKRTTRVAVSTEGVVEAFRRLLNESSLKELENIKISLGEKKRKKAASPKIRNALEKQEQKAVINEESKKSET